VKAQKSDGFLDCLTIKSVLMLPTTIGWGVGMGLEWKDEDVGEWSVAKEGE
jgi:hypothetical protein